MGANTRIKSLESALTVLLKIPADDSIGLTQLSSEVNMTKSAVFKILATYADFGFVKQNPTTKEYSLGPAVIALGANALRNIDIRQLVRPYLQILSRNYNENSMLMIRQGDEALIAEYREADVPIRLSMQLAQRHKLYYGAAPKVILAYMPEEDQDEIIKHITFKKYTSETILSEDALYCALRKIRRDGYCYSGGEFDNSGIGIAVPVFNADLTVDNSIAMNVPMFRLKDAPLDDMIHEMKTSAVTVSKALGADAAAVTRLIRL